MTNQQVALVTGASSGIGRSIAARLAAAGYRVFGTSRIPANAKPLAGVSFLALDVTDETSARDCVRSLMDQAGRLDVLVNNAGIAVMGAVEEVSPALARQQFETNYIGVVRVTQAVLPVMRAQRSGWIINISSIAALVPIPFAGHYSASKFAIEGLTEALRAEVAGLGIRVALVEPGFYRTELVSAAVPATDGISDYEPVRDRVLSRVRAIEAAAPPPTAVADLVFRLARHPAPSLRHPVGKEKIFATLKRFLPAARFEPQANKYWRVVL